MLLQLPLQFLRSSAAAPGTHDAPFCGLEQTGAAMTPINWKHDAEAAFEEARRTSRMVLLDFSAAPM